MTNNANAFSRRILPALLVAVCLFPARALFALDPVVLTDDKSEYPLGLHLEYLEDPTGKLTIEDVSSEAMAGRWVKSKKQVPSFGLTRSIYWVRFAAARRTDSRELWVLKAENRHMTDVSLFRKARAKYLRTSAGSGMPFAQRQIAYRNLLFRLDNLGDAPERIYIRFITHHQMIFPLTITKIDTLFQQDQGVLYSMGVFGGLMGILALYNLFLFISLRDRVFIEYALYLASILLYQMNLEGISFQFLWPEHSWAQYRLVNILFALMIIFAIQFTRSFLHTDRLTRPGDRWLLTMIALVSLNALRHSFFIQIPYLDATMNVLAAVTVAWMMRMAFQAWRGGLRAARFRDLESEAILNFGLQLSYREWNVNRREHRGACILVCVK